MAEIAHKRVVFVGGGHAHVQAIKALNWKARPSWMHVTLIDGQERASYSGMVPGCVSGIYTPEQTQIELSPLAQWGRIDFVNDCVVDVNPEEQLVYCSGGSSYRYDALSLDIGSTTRAYDEVEGAVAYAIPTRPISALVQRIEEIETVISRRQEEIRSEVDAVVVGGGAAGVELAFSLRARWEGKFGKIKVNVTLIAAEEKLFSEESVQVRDLHMKEIARRGIKVLFGKRAIKVTAHSVHLDNGSFVKCSEGVVLWATGAQASPLAWKLKERGIDITRAGWINVSSTLQSTSHANIFAAGDCAHVSRKGDSSPPKAGVYAVRAGPTILRNVVTHMSGDADLEEYIPQKDFLKLLGCGDGTAIGIRFGLGFYGAWVWDLKDSIDRMFMELFHPEAFPDLKDITPPLFTEQYDAVRELPQRPPPPIAASLLLSSTENDDFHKQWNILRHMMQCIEYQNLVLGEAQKIVGALPINLVKGLN